MKAGTLVRIKPLKEVLEIEKTKLWENVGSPYINEFMLEHFGGLGIVAVDNGSEACLVTTFAGKGHITDNWYNRTWLEEVKSGKGLFTISYLKHIITKYYSNDEGIDISGLDFSDIDKPIDMSGMVVKDKLLIGGLKVGNGLHQGNQEVDGYLYQSNQEVNGNLYQSNQKAYGELHNTGNKYGESLTEDTSKPLLKEISKKELAKLGYVIKEED